MWIPDTYLKWHSTEHWYSHEQFFHWTCHTSHPGRYDRYEKNKSQSQAKQGAIKKSPASAQVIQKQPLSQWRWFLMHIFKLFLSSQPPAARPTVTEAPLIDFSSPQVVVRWLKNVPLSFNCNRELGRMMLTFQTLGATAEPVSLAPSLANFKVSMLLPTILVSISLPGWWCCQPGQLDRGRKCGKAWNYSGSGEKHSSSDCFREQATTNGNQNFRGKLIKHCLKLINFQEFDQFLAERAAAGETSKKDSWRLI